MKMKKSNLGKKYDPPLSLYPMTLEQALSKALSVPLSKVVEAEKLERTEKLAEISGK
jgi:hypothetical protein